MKSKKTLLILLLSALLILLCACSSAKLTGTWVCSDLGEGNEMSYTFTDDGKYSMTDGSSTADGTYEYKGGHLYLDGEDLNDTIRIKDDTLTMYLSYGDNVVSLNFVRQK